MNNRTSARSRPAGRFTLIELLKDGKPFLGPPDQLAAYHVLMKNCGTWKVWRLCEGNGSLNVLHDAIFNR